MDELIIQLCYRYQQVLYIISIFQYLFDSNHDNNIRITYYKFYLSQNKFSINYYGSMVNNSSI